MTSSIAASSSGSARPARTLLALTIALAAVTAADVAGVNGTAADVAGVSRDSRRRCVQTYRMGASGGASGMLASLGLMTEAFDVDGACVVFYNQPTGPGSLERVAEGYLDLAFVGSVAFVAAVARGARVKVVGTPFTVIETSRLVARFDVRFLEDLRHKRLYTVRHSNFEYALLNTLQSVGINANDVAVVYTTPAQIMAAWSAGLADAAWCGTRCSMYLLNNARGGDGQRGHEMVNAGDSWNWGFGSSVAIVVSDDFLAREPAVVARVVAATNRVDYDYRASTPFDQPAPMPRRPGGPSIGASVPPDARSAGWAPGGRYLGLVEEYARLTGAPVAALPSTAFAGMFRNLRYMTAGDQLYRAQGAGPGILKTASTLFRQKVLAEDLARDSPDWYAASVDPAPLEASLRTEALPLDAGPTPFNLTAPPPLVQVPVAGESCGGGGGPVVLDVDETGSAIGDGSTGTHAYHPNAYHEG